jgi:hypothetical protein
MHEKPTATQVRTAASVNAGGGPAAAAAPVQRGSAAGQCSQAVQPCRAGEQQASPRQFASL